MRGRSKALVYFTALFLSALTLLLCLAAVAAAAPMPLKVVVNHETKQCAHIIGSDECMECYPPEGWVTIGFVHEVDCPADYEKVQVSERCVTFSDEFCGDENYSSNSNQPFKWWYGLIPALILAAVIVFTLRWRAAP